MIYKLQIWLEGDESVLDSDHFRDMYFDVSKITGWFIPDAREDIEEGAINLLFEGDIITIKQEPHIVSYLTKTFVDNSVSFIE